MNSINLKQNVQEIYKGLGDQNLIVVRRFYIGRTNPINAVVIYLNGLVQKESIENNALKPLMISINEKLQLAGICDYLIKRYILVSNSWIESDTQNIINMIKRGKTAVLIEGTSEAILMDTTGGEYRSITEPSNETVIRGNREGFVENLEINISLLKRILKDRNLVVEEFTVGRRSQTDIAMLYIKDIADSDIVNNVRKKLSSIDVDTIMSSGVLGQYMEDYTFFTFPLSRGTEKPDIAVDNLVEGRIAIIVAGTPHIMLLPCTFLDFFQTVEDYNQRTIVANFTRLLRFLAVFIVITAPSIYLTLIKFNAELIPIKFITPIIQSRIGIALTPFLEILLMEVIVEFLREGGLRLPSKIGQTLSVVGGIIIGDTAVESKIVSPTTLFIIGITVVAAFLIPNYDMSLSIRVVRFPMLILANFLGIFGIGIGWYFIITALCSTDSFGVPYLSFNKNDIKDTVVRAPIWMMNKRPELMPTGNSTRQTDFRKKWGIPRRKENEQSGE
jgi:spore germination protein KA